MNSAVLTIQVFFLSCIFSVIISDSLSGMTLCSKEEQSTIFLNTAMEFIEKAKQTIPSCTMDESNHCHMKPVDCEELLLCGHNKSGVYTIWPRNKIVKGKLDVYCDMDTDQGGWTVLQRRGNYGRPKDYFFKDWESYKNGFGDIEKDFWLGNDLIFAISNQREYSIRFDLRDVEGNSRHAHYDNFWIENEKEQYRLHISDYSGDANEAMLVKHNNQKFSTRDKDNDQDKRDCAATYKGAWWYGACHSANLNGLYHRGKHESWADGINWDAWKGNHESLDATEMKIRPKDFHKSSLSISTAPAMTL